MAEKYMLFNLDDEKAKKLGYHPIPTQSSEPESHPKQLKKETVRKIVEKRLQRNRYAEAVCKELQNVRCDLMN